MTRTIEVMFQENGEIITLTAREPNQDNLWESIFEVIPCDEPEGYEWVSHGGTSDVGTKSPSPFYLRKIGN